MRIGELIHAYAQKHDKSSSAIAKDIGIPNRTLYRIENGKPVTGETVIKLIQWLFAEEKEPTNVS